MKILLAGGGTAGHINPALAIAGYFKQRDKKCEILFAGTPNGMEVELVKKAGFDIVPIKVAGFKRGLSAKDTVHNLKSLYYLFTSNSTAKKIIKDFNPDLVIGTGGYVSGPIVLTASKMGYKTAIHEQNAFPGVTNKLLAKRVDRVFLAVKEAKKLLRCKNKPIVVGNPIRQSVIFKTKQSARKELGLDDKMCILSFGGSLGADIINKMASDLIEWNKDGKVNHIHGYGRLGKELFPRLMKEKNIDISSMPFENIREYIDNMDTCLASADLVICRSGAITLSELQATGKPSILVPSPYVSENHQYHNAMVLVNNNAAKLIEEKSYDKNEFINILNDFYNDRDKLKAYSKNSSRLAILDTTERIYNELMTLLDEKTSRNN